MNVFCDTGCLSRETDCLLSKCGEDAMQKTVAQWEDVGLTNSGASKELEKERWKPGGLRVPASCRHKRHEGPMRAERGFLASASNLGRGSTPFQVRQDCTSSSDLSFVLDISNLTAV